MDPLERSFLRELAMKRWAEAKRLRVEATFLRIRHTQNIHRSSIENARFEALIQDSRHLQERASEIIGRSEKVSERSRNLSQDAQLLVSAGPTLFEEVVDRALDLAPEVQELQPQRAVALVASGDIQQFARLKGVLGSMVPLTLGAVDAGTTLGLAIAIQPDLAVVDSDLEVASGIDSALSLPLFSPRTKALVLTDDPERAADVRLIGFDSARRDLSNSQFIDWATSAIGTAARE